MKTTIGNIAKYIKENGIANAIFKSSDEDQKSNYFLNFIVNKNGDLEISSMILMFDKPYFFGDGCNIDKGAKLMDKKNIGRYKSGYLPFALVSLVEGDVDGDILFVFDNQKVEGDKSKALNSIYSVVYDISSLTNQDIMDIISCENGDNDLFFDLVKNKSSDSWIDPDLAPSVIDDLAADVIERFIEAFNICDELYDSMNRGLNSDEFKISTDKYNKFCRGGKSLDKGSSNLLN